MEIERQSRLIEMQVELAEWDTRILTALARFQESSFDDPIRLSQQLRSLIHKRNTLRNKLDKLRQASTRSWESTWSEVERAVQDVEEAWNCVAKLSQGREDVRSSPAAKEGET